MFLFLAISTNEFGLDSLIEAGESGVNADFLGLTSMTPVPIPSAAWLLRMGLIALHLSQKKKKSFC